MQEWGKGYARKEARKGVTWKQGLIKREAREERERTEQSIVIRGRCEGDAE